MKKFDYYEETKKWLPIEEGVKPDKASIEDDIDDVFQGLVSFLANNEDNEKFSELEELILEASKRTKNMVFNILKNSSK